MLKLNRETRTVSKKELPDLLGYLSEADRDILIASMRDRGYITEEGDNYVLNLTEDQFVEIARFHRYMRGTYGRVTRELIRDLILRQHNYILNNLNAGAFEHEKNFVSLLKATEAVSRELASRVIESNPELKDWAEINDKYGGTFVTDISENILDEISLGVNKHLCVRGPLTFS